MAHDWAEVREDGDIDAALQRPRHFGKHRQHDEMAVPAKRSSLGDGEVLGVARPEGEKMTDAPKKYPHYFRDVSHLQVIDLFGVTDPCLQHALKKVMAAGRRGAKDQANDINEAIDSLSRKLEMMAEDVRAEHIVARS